VPSPTVAHMTGIVPTAPRAAGRIWRPDPPGWVQILLAAPLLAMVSLFVVTPLVLLVVRSFEDGWGAYAAFFESPAQQRALYITFRESAIVTVLCLVIGGVVAWRLRVTSSRLMRALLWAIVVIPFLMGV